jgi:hypothetical protein
LELPKTLKKDFLKRNEEGEALANPLFSRTLSLRLKLTENDCLLYTFATVTQIHDALTFWAMFQ